jgi:hypothetical protein
MKMRQIQQSILTKLKLTKDQQAKLKLHQKDMKAKMEAIREQFKKDNDRQAMRKKLTDLRKEQQDGLKSILTTEQQTKFKTELQAAVKKYRDAHKKDAAKKKDKGAGAV